MCLIFCPFCFAYLFLFLGLFLAYASSFMAGLIFFFLLSGLLKFFGAFLTIFFWHFGYYWSSWFLIRSSVHLEHVWSFYSDFLYIYNFFFFFSNICSTMSFIRYGWWEFITKEEPNSLQNQGTLQRKKMESRNVGDFTQQEWIHKKSLSIGQWWWMKEDQHWIWRCCN